MFIFLRFVKLVVSFRLVSQWKERWFSIDHKGSMLLYSLSPADAAPLGNILLADCLIEHRPPDCIVFIKHPARRQIELMFQSRNEAERWVEALSGFK